MTVLALALTTCARFGLPPDPAALAALPGDLGDLLMEHVRLEYTGGYNPHDKPGKRGRR